MRRAWGLALVALVGLACEAGWLHERGLRVIREVSVGQGLRLLEDPATVLLQVRDTDARGERVAGTSIVSETDTLPAHLGDRVVVLAEDVEQAFRMAARLSRAGIQEVSVVRGGVSAWQAARRGTPGEEPALEHAAGEASS